MSSFARRAMSLAQIPSAARAPASVCQRRGLAGAAGTFFSLSWYFLRSNDRNFFHYLITPSDRVEMFSEPIELIDWLFWIESKKNENVADHHGSTKVDFWKQPTNPGNWKEEHVRFFISLFLFLF